MVRIFSPTFPAFEYQVTPKFQHQAPSTEHATSPVQAHLSAKKLPLSNLPFELRSKILKWAQGNLIHEEFKIHCAALGNNRENEAISKLIPEDQHAIWKQICCAVSPNMHQQQDTDFTPTNEILINEIVKFTHNELLLKGLTYPVLRDLTEKIEDLSKNNNEKKALRLLDDLLQSDELTLKNKQHLLDNLAYAALSEPLSANARSEVASRIDKLREHISNENKNALQAQNLLSGNGVIVRPWNNRHFLPKQLKDNIQTILRYEGTLIKDSNKPVILALSELVIDIQQTPPNTEIRKTIQINHSDRLVIHATHTIDELHFKLRLPVATHEGNSAEEQSAIESAKRNSLINGITSNNLLAQSKTLSAEVFPPFLRQGLDAIWRDGNDGISSLALIDSLLMTENDLAVRADILSQLLDTSKNLQNKQLRQASTDSKLVKLIEKYTKGGTNSLVGKNATKLIAQLVDAMGDMRAGQFQHSWETGIELLSKKKGRTHERDPQLRAYKVVKRYLNDAMNSPIDLNKVISSIWEGEVLNKMSNSTRRIETSHWKKGITSIAVTGGIYGLTHALVPVIEVSLGIDLKLAAAKEKLNVDLDLLEKLKHQQSDTIHFREELYNHLKQENDLIVNTQLNIHHQASSIPNDSAVNTFLKNNTEVHVVNGNFVSHFSGPTDHSPLEFGDSSSIDNLSEVFNKLGPNSNEHQIQDIGDIIADRNVVDYDKLMQCLDKSDPSHLNAADQETIANLKQSLRHLSDLQADSDKTLVQISQLNKEILHLYADQTTNGTVISSDNYVVSTLQKSITDLNSSEIIMHTAGIGADVIATANEKTKNQIFNQIFTTGSKIHQELSTWGPVGIRNIAKASYKAYDKAVLSSPREALRRLTPDILKKTRAQQIRQLEQRTESQELIQAARAIEEAQNALDVQINFAKQTEQAVPAVKDAQGKKVTLAKRALEAAVQSYAKQEESEARLDIFKTIGDTWQTVLKNLHTKDLSLDRKAETLHECIKELDESRVMPIHHRLWETARENAMKAADRQMLIDILPRLKPHPASYAWLAQYLMSSGPTTNSQATNLDPLPEKTTKNIESTLRNYARPVGTLRRAQLRTSAMKAGHKITPAWLRPDFGLIGGAQGRRDRTAAIEAERSKQLLNRQKKEEKIAAGAQKLQTMMPSEQGKKRAQSVVDRLKRAAPSTQENNAGSEE